MQLNKNSCNHVPVTSCPKLCSFFKFICDPCEIDFVCMVSLIRHKGVDQKVGFDLSRPLTNDLAGKGACSKASLNGRTLVPKLRNLHGGGGILRKNTFIF